MLILRISNASTFLGWRRWNGSNSRYPWCSQGCPDGKETELEKCKLKAFTKSHHSSLSTRPCEGIPNISSLGWHLDHAVNGIANVLSSGHKQGGHRQHHHRCLKCKGWLPNVKLVSSETHLVMKTKDIVVNCDRVLYLEKMGEVTKEFQHNVTFLKTSLLAPF